MAETLRIRVGRVIAGSLNALIDKLEDQAPEAMMEQAIREVDEVIDDVRSELGTVAANRHLAQQQHANLNKRHLELTSNVEHAIDQNRDDLARAAVARQLDIEAQLPVLETTLADLGKSETELKGYVDALLGKKREMHEAVNAFRSSRAKATNVAGGTAAASPSAGKLDSASAAFDKVYARQTGMTMSDKGATLEQGAKLKELEDMVQENKIPEANGPAARKLRLAMSAPGRPRANSHGARTRPVNPMNLFTAPETLPFGVAFGVLIGLAIIEGVGAFAAASPSAWLEDLLPHHDGASRRDWGWLAWLAACRQGAVAGSGRPLPVGIRAWRVRPAGVRACGRRIVHPGVDGGDSRGSSSA